MTRHFKLTDADGGEVFVSVEGDQPDPVAPEGGSLDVMAEAFVIPPPAMPRLPAPNITRRQLILALLGAGFITPAEALAAARDGTVPASVAALFAALPADKAVAAEITWASMSVAERDSPLLTLMIAAGLATAEQVDALFAVGRTL